MSLINLLTRKAPTLGSADDVGIEVFEFDAVFEESLEATVTTTQYPIESGAVVADHVIINPKKYSITGGVSNNPLSPQITDFAGGLLTNFVENKADGVIAGAAGISAGALGGTDGNRAKAALEKLQKLMTDRKPFTFDTDDLTLVNMIITDIRRTRDPSNQNALVFTADMQELPTLNAVVTANAPNPTKVETDPSSNMITSDVNKGQVVTSTPSTAATTAGSAF